MVFVQLVLLTRGASAAGAQHDDRTATNEVPLAVTRKDSRLVAAPLLPSAETHIDLDSVFEARPIDRNPATQRVGASGVAFNERLRIVAGGARRLVLAVTRSFDDLDYSLSGAGGGGADHLSLTFVPEAIVARDPANWGFAWTLLPTGTDVATAFANRAVVQQNRSGGGEASAKSQQAGSGMLQGRMIERQLRPVRATDEVTLAVKFKGAKLAMEARASGSISVLRAQSGAQLQVRVVERATVMQALAARYALPVERRLSLRSEGTTPMFQLVIDSDWQLGAHPPAQELFVVPRSAHCIPLSTVFSLEQIEGSDAAPHANHGGGDEGAVAFRLRSHNPSKGEYITVDDEARSVAYRPLRTEAVSGNAFYRVATTPDRSKAAHVVLRAAYGAGGNGNIVSASNQRVIELRVPKTNETFTLWTDPLWSSQVLAGSIGVAGHSCAELVPLSDANAVLAETIATVGGALIEGLTQGDDAAVIAACGSLGPVVSDRSIGTSADGGEERHVTAGLSLLQSGLLWHATVFVQDCPPPAPRTSPRLHQSPTTSLAAFARDPAETAEAIDSLVALVTACVVAVRIRLADFLGGALCGIPSEAPRDEDLDLFAGVVTQRIDAVAESSAAVLADLRQQPAEPTQHAEAQSEAIERLAGEIDEWKNVASGAAAANAAIGTVKDGGEDAAHNGAASTVRSIARFGRSVTSASDVLGCADSPCGQSAIRKLEHFALEGPPPPSRRRRGDQDGSDGDESGTREQPPPPRRSRFAGAERPPLGLSVCPQDGRLKITVNESSARPGGGPSCVHGLTEVMRVSFKAAIAAVRTGDSAHHGSVAVASLKSIVANALNTPFPCGGVLSKPGLARWVALCADAVPPAYIESLVARAVNDPRACDEAVRTLLEAALHAETDAAGASLANLLRPFSFGYEFSASSIGAPSFFSEALSLPTSNPPSRMCSSDIGAANAARSVMSALSQQAASDEVDYTAGWLAVDLSLGAVQPGGAEASTETPCDVLLPWTLQCQLFAAVRRTLRAETHISARAAADVAETAWRTFNGDVGPATFVERLAGMEDWALVAPPLALIAELISVLPGMFRGLTSANLQYCVERFLENIEKDRKRNPRALLSQTAAPLMAAVRKVAVLASTAVARLVEAEDERRARVLAFSRLRGNVTSKAQQGAADPSKDANGDGATSEKHDGSTTARSTAVSPAAAAISAEALALSHWIEFTVGKSDLVSGFNDVTDELTCMSQQLAANGRIDPADSTSRPMLEASLRFAPLAGDLKVSNANVQAMSAAFNLEGQQPQAPHAPVHIDAAAAAAPTPAPSEADGASPHRTNVNNSSSAAAAGTRLMEIAGVDRLSGGGMRDEHRARTPRGAAARDLPSALPVGRIFSNTSATQEQQHDERGRGATAVKATGRPASSRSEDSDGGDSDDDSLFSSDDEAFYSDEEDQAALAAEEEQTNAIPAEERDALRGLGWLMLAVADRQGIVSSKAYPRVAEVLLRTTLAMPCVAANATCLSGDVGGKVLSGALALLVTLNLRESRGWDSMTALHAACDLLIAALANGHRPTQELLLAELKARPDRHRLVTVLSPMLMTRLPGAGASDPDVHHLHCRLLRLLHLMCEGHFLPMQRFLGDQSTVVLQSVCTPVLIVQFIAHTWVKTSAPVDGVRQAMRTLAEIMQGPCRENQDLCVAAGAAEVLLGVLSGAGRRVPIEQQSGIADATLSALFALLEGHHDAGVYGRVAEATLTPAVRLCIESRLQQSHEAVVASGGNPQTLDCPEHRPAADLYGFLRVVEDSLPKRSNVRRDMLQLLRPYRKTIGASLASVEIAWRGRVHRVFFPFLEIKGGMLQARRKEILHNAAVVSAIDGKPDEDRLSVYLASVPEYIAEVRAYGRERLVSPGARIVATYAEWSLLLLAIVVNVFLMTFATTKPNPDDVETYNVDNAGIEYRDIGIIVLGLTVLQFLCHLAYSVGSFIGIGVQFRSAYTVHFQRLKRGRADGGGTTSSARIVLMAHAAMHAFEGVAGRVVARVFFTVMAFSALFSPICHAFMVLLLVEVVGTLRRVLTSIVRNAKSLLWTAALMVVMMYCFAAVTFYTGYTKYFTPDTTGIGGNCDNLPQCLFILATYGLPTTGGITEKLLKPAFHFNGDDDESYWRMIYDFLFFVVFNVLLLNLVFGVILDTFATLRQERHAVSKFLGTRCFVCGLEHSAIGDMRHHVKKEHNVWAYAAYIDRVVATNPVDRDGLTSYVAEMVEAGNPGFFPYASVVTAEGASS